MDGLIEAAERISAFVGSRHIPGCLGRGDIDGPFGSYCCGLPALRDALQQLQAAEQPMFKRLARAGDLCSHCDTELTEALVCPGCGWADPIPKERG